MCQTDWHRPLNRILALYSHVRMSVCLKCDFPLEGEDKDRTGVTSPTSIMMNSHSLLCLDGTTYFPPYQKKNSRRVKLIPAIFNFQSDKKCAAYHWQDLLQPIWLFLFFSWIPCNANKQNQHQYRNLILNQNYLPRMFWMDVVALLNHAEKKALHHCGNYCTSIQNIPGMVVDSFGLI